MDHAQHKLIEVYTPISKGSKLNTKGIKLFKLSVVNNVDT